MHFVNNPTYFYINFMGTFFFPGIVRPCFRQSMGKINISWRYISFLCASEEEEHLVLSGYGERFGLFQGIDHHQELSSCLVTYLLFLRTDKSTQCHALLLGLVGSILNNCLKTPWIHKMLVNIPHLLQGPTQILSPADSLSTGMCLSQPLML